MQTVVNIPAPDTDAEDAVIARAIESERQWIAQALHDHLCQLLLGASFSAKALADGLKPGSTEAQHAAELARLINSAAQQTRKIVRDLEGGLLQAK